MPRAGSPESPNGKEQRIVEQIGAFVIVGFIARLVK